MEEKKVYVIYDIHGDSELLVRLTKEESKVINWFLGRVDMTTYNMVEIENYEVEEIS